ncbi:hypothetical protein JCM6882_007202 [Rhodosporidiobolus microsporus]
MPKPFPLSSLRLKISKTTILLPVSSATTLSTLRATLLSALEATAASNADDDALPPLPSSAADIALWRLEAPDHDMEGNEIEKWVRLTDEKSGADKWGVSESEEIGVSFKAGDGSFPTPIVIRPVDEYEE